VAAVFPLYSDIDNEFSLMYLSVADSFFKEGKYEDAEIFLNKALIYNQEISDPYYISAVIKKPENITESINLFKKSLTLRKWHIYSEADAFFELGILYNRVKDHERAIASLYSVKDDYIDNSEFLDAYTASLLRRGYFKEARELLDYALKRYPFVNTFKTRLAGIDTDYLDNLIVNVLDSANSEEYDPGLLVSLAQLVSDKGVKKEIVENLYGTDYQ
jgi:tetratricopeptide (TPR) repeat protein